MSMLCFLFGHSDAPEDIAPDIREEIERLYSGGVKQFIVGHYGRFDRMAIKILSEAKHEHPDMVLNLLTPWHPAERPAETPSGFDGQFYPPIESVPRRYAIVRANNYVLDIADIVICYVDHAGNTQALLEKACRRKLPIVINIADKRKKGLSV